MFGVSVFSFKVLSMFHKGRVLKTVEVPDDTLVLDALEMATGWMMAGYDIEWVKRPTDLGDGT